MIKAARWALVINGVMYIYIYLIYMYIIFIISYNCYITFIYGRTELGALEL